MAVSKFKVGDRVRFVGASHDPVYVVDLVVGHDIGLEGQSGSFNEALLEIDLLSFDRSLQQFARRTHTLPVSSTERKEFPLWRGLMRYAPAALAAIARVSKIGNDKHNPGEPMHHSRGKSNDHEDCIMRHLLDMEEDFGKGRGRDENGLPQVDMLAWRAIMLCQIWHEQNDGAPLAPAAKVE